MFSVSKAAKEDIAIALKREVGEQDGRGITNARKLVFIFLRPFQAHEVQNLKLFLRRQFLGQRAFPVVWMERAAPKNEELLRFRGEAAALLRLSEKAADLAPQALTDELELWTLSLDADPKAAWAYRWRAQIHLSRRNFDKAILDFAKVIELKPLDPEAWYDRGNGHYSLKHHAEAFADFSKCLELKADHLDALHLRGHCHEAMGRWKESVADHTRAIELAPKNLQLHICRGHAYAQLEDWQKAAAAFEHATTLKPDYPLAGYSLAMLELQRGDRAGYRKVCSRMLERFD